MDDADTTDATVDEATGQETPASAAEPVAAGAEEGFQAASFQESQPVAVSGTGEGQPDIDVILDVPVTLSLEVGRTKMTVGELLSLRQGSVVELDRLAGEPLDVLVNGQLVAHGEIVVINDKFGIRLVDVVSPLDPVEA